MSRRGMGDVVPRRASGDLPADLDLSGLQLWWDPSYGASLDGSSRGSSWAARFGGGTLTQGAAGSRPLMSTLGGKPCWLYAQARNDTLSTGSIPSSLALLAPCTVYCVCMPTGTGQRSAWAAAAASNIISQGIVANLDYASRFGTGTSTPQEWSGSAPPTAYVAGYSFNGTQVSSWMNGIVSVAPQSSDRSVVATTLYHGAGTNGGASSANWDGYLGDLIIFTSSHNTARVLSTSNWLRTRYGF